MVAPWPVFEPGGVSKVVAGLGAALEKSGAWRVIYLELADRDADVGAEGTPRVYRRRIRPFLPPGSGPRTWVAFSLTLVPTLLRLRALLRRERVTVVNVHYPTPEAWAFAFLRRTGLFRGRLVLSVHGLDIREALRHPERARTMRRIYKAADLVVACSEALARDVPRLAPELAGRTRAVHNGLDSEGAGSSRGQDSRVEAPATAAPTVLSVATFEPKKGLDVLVQAFAVCLTNHPSLRLSMIGQRRRNVGTFEEIAGRVQALGLADRVSLATDVPNQDVLRAMSTAAVLVLPSRQEPFGLVLLEAGTLGTPVVASDVDGIPEVIPSREYGLLVRPDDPAALADAICEVLRDPAAARHRAANLQRRVREQFTWGAAASAYDALIAGLAKSAVRPD